MISIITVCFNSVSTIKRTFDSMLIQSFTDYEYIVIDGGSTDGTLDIIKEYVIKFKGKMKYVSEPDQGIYDAMNKGINFATGNLIGIINSDDWYEEDTLEIVSKTYTGEKYQVIYGMENIWESKKLKQIVFYNHEFLEEQMIAHPSCFITKACYMDFGNYNSEEYMSSADYDLMLRYFYSNEITFTSVYEVFANFATGGMSSNDKSALETLELKKKYNLISKRSYLIKRLKYFLKIHFNL